MLRIAAVAIILAGALGLASLAAQAGTIVGVVKDYDATADVVELDVGSAMSIKPGVDASTITVGAVVILETNIIDGVELVTAVEAD